jgi:hypothetical protein
MATQTNTNKRQSSASAQRPSGRVPSADSTQGTRSQRATTGGAQQPDETYALISIIYHALQGAETTGKYIEDARRSGDDELVSFFQESQRIDNERAARAKKLLAQKLDDDDEEDEEDSEDEEDDEDDEDDEDES